MINIALNFEGRRADDHQLDLYDAAHAMLGFQRSLAITTHLVINGEIITKTPYLKNAKIYSTTPQKGSWEIAAVIATMGGLAYKVGTAPKETPLGHLVYSAYDYIISNTLGFHVDYDETLGKTYNKMKADQKVDLPIVAQSQLDSAIEKCDTAIQEMHRPIIKSESAESAQIIRVSGQHREAIARRLNANTYQYIHHTVEGEGLSSVTGRISSYNVNTYKGRIYIQEEKRPISFELGEEAQSVQLIRKITSSLSLAAVDRFDRAADVSFNAYKLYSSAGQLKSLHVVGVPD